MPSSTEEFWGGEFGDEYTARNTGEKIVQSNTELFRKALDGISDIESVIEFGANRGLNIEALKRLFPDRPLELAAIEINKTAAESLRKIGGVDVTVGSFLDFKIGKHYDLSLSKGVLIHINPADLQKAYERLYEASKRFILIVEYFNPTPVEINYRGFKGKLWKRDFCGEMLDLYPDLQLIRYGFVYSRDPVAPLDNVNWFLMSKGQHQP